MIYMYTAASRFAYPARECVYYNIADGGGTTGAHATLVGKI